jgi:hypothetical protein
MDLQPGGTTDNQVDIVGPGEVALEHPLDAGGSLGRDNVVVHGVVRLRCRPDSSAADTL